MLIITFIFKFYFKNWEKDKGTINYYIYVKILSSIIFKN